MGLTKGQKFSRPRKPIYDAYVLYKGDNVVGVFDTLDDIATFTGYERVTVAQWSQPSYRRAFDEGKHHQNHYLIQPVKFDRHDV